MGERIRRTTLEGYIKYGRGDKIGGGGWKMIKVFKSI